MFNESQLPEIVKYCLKNLVHLDQICESVI